MRKLILILVVISFASGLAEAQLPTAGVLDPSRVVDWTTAGIPGGIPARNTICSSLNSGATAATINAAISTCPAGQVVFLNAGTFNISGVTFAGKSNVTLRGAGADQTFLVFTGHTGCFGAQSDLCVPNLELNYPQGPVHTANWTSGYTVGTTSITLSSTTELAIGNMLFLDQLNSSSDGGGIYVCEVPNTCSQEIPAGAERSGRAQIQIVKVTGISGGTVTFTPGLYMPNWDAGNSPGAWWGNTTVTMDGIENLSMDHTSGGAASGVTFFDCYQCWLSGVRSIDPNRNHVWLESSARILIKDSYFFNTQNHASESYGVETYPSSDCLVQNNVFQQVTTPIQLNSAASGCVIAHNFTINNVYLTNPNWMIAGNSMHAAGLDMTLFEGNESNAFISDNIHGTHNFITAFRNQYVGWEIGKTTQTNAFQVYAWSRFYNLVGNIEGKAGYHNQYQDLTPSGTNSDKSIYTLGWSGNTGTTGPAGPNDTLVASTMMRWGNCDTVTNTCRFVSGEVPSGLGQFANAVPANNNLPSSFYLGAKPSWWRPSVPFPAIGPDVSGGTDSTGHVYDNTAKYCYSNPSLMNGPADGTGGVLSFNASNCYSYAPITPTPQPITTTIM